MPFTLAFAAALVSAAEAAPPLNCKDPQSNLEMKMCAQQDFQRADAELNKVYAEAVAGARAQNQALRDNPGNEKAPDSVVLLRKAQRAWIAFRDANCAYEYQIYYGGSHASLAYSLCQVTMTKARIAELKAQTHPDEESAEQP
jgi:uncharacterized protein YecT (DUF1311 family)